MTTTAAQIIENLTVGQMIGCYEVVALEADRVALADHSWVRGNCQNPSRRWYKLTSPTLAGRIDYQIKQGAVA